MILYKIRKIPILKKLHKKIRFYNKIVKNFLVQLFWINRLEFIRINDRKIIYFVNSKVACTSIKISIAKSIYPDWNIVNNFYEVHKIQFDKINKIRNQNYNYFIFTYVRDPFIRLVSCYKSKFFNDKDLNLNDFKFYFNKKLRNGNLSFDDFVSIICKIPNRLCDKHFIPQYYLLKKAGLNHFSKILKLEKIEETYPYIAERFNLQPLEKFNSSNANDDWLKYYSIKTAEKVRKKYRHDITYFNYLSSYNKILAYNVNNN